MLNAIYQLTAPRKFEVLVRNEAISYPNQVIVRPTYLSICNADQRYYQGTRDAEVLKKKLPMALIHEGIGEIVYDRSGDFPIGSRVVMIPNLPSETNPYIAENYLRTSKFRASSCDGFMQEVLISSPDRLLILPDNVDNGVAAFTELISVAFHSINRFINFSHSDCSIVGVWGDGNMGFIVSLLLKRMEVAKQVYVFGHNYDKLADFTFADKTFLTSEVPKDLVVCQAFECAGGQGSVSAINQIIDHIQPEGCVSLLGVSENQVPINTRMVLEKGLRLIGNSRSGRSDFKDVLNLYREDMAAVDYLKRIVGDIHQVSSIDDIRNSFESDIAKHYGKTVMQWNI